MMWAGATLIILASACAGWELSGRLERRTKLLRHIKVALETLDTEVAFAMIPLSQALNQVARQLPSPAKDFFLQVAERLETKREPAAEAWEQELDLWKSRVDLDEKDVEILRQFGQSLGQQDIQGQRKQIQLAQSYLNNMETMAWEAQRKYQSMYRSLGILGGLLLVIMLL
ncbi:stage III sporulation protein AB [Salipaludibacillus sp. CUR1]|uniref:stage III sporulation protein SpoIIIAB n=1 Tax=Salipaludibacillus sp. CUR1 TaxID=2820003 RepID=UPI001E540181|nr:stage III sporulation protein SpoIIIAB [Salipaludibacillus sp. CUR1]MCE7794319.1 stage III sporulation protein AB [Salipaludibacillus sp. CUR1]